MADTTSKIKLIFDGAERGVVAAATKSAAAIRSLDDDNSKLSKSADKAGSSLLGIGKALAGIGAAGSAVQVVGGVAGALAQLAPAALVMPGALLAGAAAMQTFKLATSGFGEAVGAGLSGDLEAFAEATKKMHPEMAKAAAEVVKLKPRIDDLKKSVQGRFWDGFSAEIKKTADTILPALSRELPGVADGFNRIGKEALRAAQTGFFKSDVQIVLFNTGKTLKNMGSVAADVMTGFVRLGAAGSSYLPRLGKAIDEVATKFANWAEKITAGENSQFSQWVDKAVAGFQSLGRIAGNIGSSIGSVFRGLGTDFGSPLAKIEELTGKVAAFLKSVQGQDALRALGETLRVVSDQVGRVLDAGLRELGPTLKSLAPVAQEVARTLGDLLVGAIETLGPIIRGVANTFNEFPGSAGAATVAVVGFVAAIKTIKAVNAVTDLLGIERAFGGIGKAAGGKAAEEAGKAAAVSWGRGFTGGLALVGVGVGGTIILDKVLPMDAAKTHGSQAARDMLHEMASVFQGEGNIFQAWDVSRWISNPISMAVEVGRRKLMELFGFEPPTVPVHVDTKPASNEFLGWQHKTSDSVATAQLDADPAKANAARAGWGTATMATTATAHLNAEASGAHSSVAGWKGAATATTATSHLDAEHGRATGSVQAWKGSADRTTATAHLHAETGGAQGVIDGFIRRNDGRQIRIYTSVLGSGGIASAGRLAAGGPVEGPGTGTSDTAGLFALSNGEYVATASQVDAAGGPAAFGRLMKALERGPRAMASGGSVSSMRASAQAAMRTPTPARGSSGGGTVVQFVGNTSDALATVIMGMIRQGKIQIKAA